MLPHENLIEPLVGGTGGPGLIVSLAGEAKVA